MAAREAERMKAAAATEAAAAEAATRAAAATAAANGAPPTMSEVEAAIRLLRNTSPGLSAQLLKLGGRPLAEWAHRVITRVWETGKVPLAWKRASLKALYKGKKDRRQADNYRGVTLLDVSGKVFVGRGHPPAHQAPLMRPAAGCTAGVSAWAGHRRRTLLHAPPR